MSTDDTDIHYILEQSLYSPFGCGPSFLSTFGSFILSFLGVVIGVSGIPGIGFSMEHWRQLEIPPVNAEDEKLSCSSRFLAVTSGNVQAYALDTKKGIENRDPLNDIALERTPITSDSLQYHLQVPTSNHHQENIHHLQVRRQRHRNGLTHAIRPQEDPPRPFLTCEKYLAYKYKRRMDSGKDGALVWDPTTEEAFQDALVKIIPMGRKKKIRDGKLLGRNQLISEYIFQQTGAERDRKQVSSHIQVLKHLLGGIPEWDALIQATEDSNDSDAHECYDTSVRDMVHERSHGPRMAQNVCPSTSYGSDLPPPAFTLGSNTDHTEKHSVAKLNFVMWVSPPNPAPNQMTDQLHRYTEVQCCDTGSQPISLESNKNWRMSFPHLASIVEYTSPSQCCDVILLEASFRLMPDFPPPSCKLGITLELDFRHPIANMKALEELHDWTWICVTRMYEHGKCFRQTHHHCDLTKQKMEIGKVAPSFESKYWAEKFVNLIERQRGAEESGNDGAISAANEKSRKFFSGLSAMQELVAYAPHEVPLLETQSKPPQGKKMAILLWKFSQAQAGHVGITTWQKLIPPPHRNTVNSPPPAQDMALPPLAMDSMIEDMQEDPNFSIYKGLHSQQSEHAPYQFYDTTLDEHTTLIDHEEYDMSFRDEDFAIPPSYHLPVSQGDLSHSSFPSQEQFPLDYQYNEASFNEHDPAQQSANFFAPQQGHYSSQHEQQISGLPRARPAYRVPEFSRHDTAEEQEQRRPLNDFDHSTHKILQAQLEQDEARGHDAEEEALQAALAAASAMNDLGAQDHPHFSHSPQQQHFHDQGSSWEMPFSPQQPLSRFPNYATGYSHHSPLSEHLTAVVNQGAFDANQLESALQSHDSNFGASINNLEHHADNYSPSVPRDGDHCFMIDPAAALAHETAVKNEDAPNSDAP